MTKTLNNGIIFTMANVLMGSNPENPGLMGKKYLHSVMAIRQALKFNCAAISEKNRIIMEMVSDINRELLEEYCNKGKAIEDEDNYIVKNEFQKEFLKEQQEKLDELSTQPIDIELVTYPQEKFDIYVAKNDGELTDIELDILEMFIEEETGNMNNN